jgi:hypothetical protein
MERGTDRFRLGVVYMQHMCPGHPRLEEAKSLYWVLEVRSPRKQRLQYQHIRGNEGYFELVDQTAPAEYYVLKSICARTRSFGTVNLLGVTLFLKLDIMLIIVGLKTTMSNILWLIGS